MLNIRSRRVDSTVDTDWLKCPKSRRVQINISADTHTTHLCLDLISNTKSMDARVPLTHMEWNTYHTLKHRTWLYVAGWDEFLTRSRTLMIGNTINATLGSRIPCVAVSRQTIKGGEPNAKVKSPPTTNQSTVCTYMNVPHSIWTLEVSN